MEKHKTCMFVNALPCFIFILKSKYICKYKNGMEGYPLIWLEWLLGEKICKI